MGVINGQQFDTYQRLVVKEIEKLRDFDNDFNNSSTYLKPDDLNIDYPEVDRLIREGLLIKFSEDSFRTAHGDLLFRLVNIRNLEDQHPIPFEFKLLLKEELVPDFDAHRFESVLPQIIEDQRIRDIIFSSFRNRTQIKGLSSYQLPIIRQISKREYRNIAIVAPTASGKTLSFFLPCFIAALNRAFTQKDGISSVLIYPRRALERDQMRFLLSIIDNANQMLLKRNLKQITVGLDDSDTPKRNEVKKGSSFRNLKCPSCQSELMFSPTDADSVICRGCSRSFDYIFPTKESVWEKKPTILITNIWAIYRRLLTPRTVDMFKGLDYVVVDEAHVYTHYLGGHVSYIIRLLRSVANNGSSATFIFASATIPNPEQFLSSLAAVKEEDLFYIDFEESLKKSGNIVSKRLLIHLYLLPHPISDIETLTEAIVLASTLWCHKHHWRSLTFIDSIAEINTMKDYFEQTILGEREGREVTDHVFSVSIPGPFNTYDWKSLAPISYCSGLKELKAFVLSDFKRSIGMHYGGLNLEKRAEIESEFFKGSIRTLLSTSTLELGIDLSQVAIVVQHKLPLTPEGVVQRIGRAGRSPDCYRIALGIVILPSLPLSTLYMFDDRLRQRLEDVSFLAPLKLGQTSDNLLIQYTLSLLLLKRALEKKSTNIDIEKEGLKTRNELLPVLKTILDDLQQLPSFNSKIEFLPESELAKSTETLKQLITKMISGITKLSDSRVVIDDSIEVLDSEISSNIGRAYEAADLAKEFNALIKGVKELPSKDLEYITTLDYNLRNVCGVLREISKIIGKAVEDEEPRIIQAWLSRNLNKSQETFSTIPSTDQTLEITNRLLSDLSRIGFKKFRENTGLDPFKILTAFSALGELFGSGEDDKLLAFLNKIPGRLEKLSSFRFDALSAARALDRFEVEAKHALGGKLDLFTALSVLFEGKAYFSLLLDTPSPDLELIGTEDL